MNPRRMLAAFTMLSTLAGVGCSQSPGAVADEADAVGQAAEPVYALSTALWPTRDIAVCFESNSPGSTASRDLVREAVEGSWERVADVDFTGWGLCTSTSCGIRIRFADENPRVLELGTGIDGMSGGMVLNETYVQWGSDCQQQKTFCTRAIAVHEFGHALGIAHEHNRDDRDASCVDAPQGPDGDTYVTPYDADSVMNYCNQTTEQLSMNDVVGIQRLYGAKPRKSLVSAGGKCVKVATYSQGTYLRTDGCEDNQYDRWQYDVTKGTFRNASTQCASFPSAGSTAQIATCNGSAAQEGLSFAGVEIRGYGDQCISLPSALIVGQEYGVNLQAKPCWSMGGGKISVRQQWTYLTSRELKSWYASDMCLSIEGGQAVSGAKIEAARCNGSAVQRWTFADGKMKSDASTNLCVRFHTGTSDAFMYDCSALSDERAWHLSGPISKNGQCLEAIGASNDGQTLALKTCDATSPKQIFDYRP